MIQLLSVAVLFLCASLHQSNAAPGSSLESRFELAKRTNAFAGCDPQQTAWLTAALRDMMSLANAANVLANVQRPGFTHYFQDHELQIFQTATDVIRIDNVNPNHHFIIDCNPPPNVLAACGGTSYAITEAVAGNNRRMFLCPLFWTGPDTARLLPRTTDQAALATFCGPANRPYRDFVTAGHVLLHEITHLDAVAQQFPLTPDAHGRHGTLDYALGASPIQDARRLRVRIANGQANLQSPLYTAESYAGAATELWVEHYCQRNFVAPLAGY